MSSMSGATLMSPPDEYDDYSYNKESGSSKGGYKARKTPPSPSVDHGEQPPTPSRSSGATVHNGHTERTRRTRQSPSPPPALRREPSFETLPTDALADAVGADNVPYTTEIDTVPCAGIVIPNGAFQGLLVWRLVVRLQHTDKPSMLPRQPYIGVGAEGSSNETLHGMTANHGPLASTSSLPATATATDQWTVLPRPADESYPCSAVVANFILDTSSPRNTITRPALEALGVPETRILQLEQPASKAKTIVLYIQSIQHGITFHLADYGHPGRLGVRFLEESGANVSMESGRGGVLWVDTTSRMRSPFWDIPRTIPLPKPAASSLQARVRAIFCLPNPS